MGGGADLSYSVMPARQGPSPRGRGSPQCGWLDEPDVGSIPAWAGEPGDERRDRARDRVHPRVGGGAFAQVSGLVNMKGPSPRGRGSLERDAVERRRLGSIPAWAGEPAIAIPGFGPAKVHPRVGGGASGLRAGRRSGAGPSPRGRGSRMVEHLEFHEPGSIPAWAGEPPVSRGHDGLLRVHPRVGGGASDAELTRAITEGPSPRGRGSRGRARRAPPRCGSIPAWAGEPRRDIPEDEQ